jgi:phosphoribosylaminoimidazole-succinocarboxamide synthase
MIWLPIGFEETAHIIPNHVLLRPHPNVFVTTQVDIIPVEVVVRGYLTGSAWRDYEAGKDISGIRLKPGLSKSARFDSPLLTPSTKAERGEHDEPISVQDILRLGLVEKKLWEQISETALSLFEYGTRKAKERGLILVDTKYEFGTSKGKQGEY